ncbi:MAG: hypothetical protein ACYCPW_07785 [Nitrososphaerales archaeon]
MTSNGESANEADSNLMRDYSEAVNYGFEALGDQVSGVIINFISKKYNLRAAETFSKPELLCEAMERTLGAGALLIEKRIIRRLYDRRSSSTHLQIEVNNRQDFSRYIRDFPRDSEQPI